MAQPWVSRMDCPVSAPWSLERNTSVLATSSTVVNTPSTYSRSMMFFTTSSSLMPREAACSGICFSTRGVLMKLGQIT